MAIIKCKMCGGNLIPSMNGFGVCDSCGLQQSLTERSVPTENTFERFIKTKDKITKSAPKEADETIEPLIKRVFLFLEDGKWQNADEYCEKVLDMDPEFAPAYLAKLMLEYRVKRPELLSNLTQDFTMSGNYQKAVRYGDDTMKSALAGYYNNAKSNIETRAMQGNYNVATAKMKTAKTEADFVQAAEMFKMMGNYGNSVDLAETCARKAEDKRCAEIYSAASKLASKSDEASLKEAIEKFAEIPNYKDSITRADKCEAKIKRTKSMAGIKGIIAAVFLLVFTVAKFVCSAKWASYLDLSIIKEDLGIKGWLEILGTVISLMALEVVLTSAVSLAAQALKIKRLRLGEIVMFLITAAESFMMASISCPQIFGEKFATIYLFYFIFSIVCNFTVYILMLALTRLIRKLTK
ncbi:MAG: hypothetical protein MJ120_05135 [Clostridia bacterium]|nr:hypothetical protein [Clostridia bacterium]